MSVHWGVGCGWQWRRASGLHSQKLPWWQNGLWWELGVRQPTSVSGNIRTDYITEWAETIGKADVITCEDIQHVTLFQILFSTRGCFLQLDTDVSWVVTPCASYKNRRFGVTSRHHHQDDKIRRARNNVSSNIVLLRSMVQLLVTANVVPRSPILVILMMVVMFLRTVDSYKSHTA
jgi:hypothetical protein